MNDRALLGMVAAGTERTLDRDPAFAVRILVDIAIKALSLAINDPTSAVMAIGHLHELLAPVGAWRVDAGQYRDADGHARLDVGMPRWLTS